MTLLLSRSDVSEIAWADGGRALDLLIERIEDAYSQLHDGVAAQHARIYLRPQTEARRPPGLFSMSALLPRTARMGTRLMAITQQGKAGAGVLVLFDHVTSELLAIVDDELLHSYRSGAPAGLATRMLARPESEVVACIGSSTMAMGGLVMTSRSLPNLSKVLIYSPNEERRSAFAAEMADTLGVEVVAVESADIAAAQADVVVIGTNADRPVVSDDAIRPGTHISVLARNEVPMTTFRRSRIVLGSRMAQRELDPPWSDPIPDGWVDAELSDLVGGTGSRRTEADDVTVFVGSGPLAMWDVAAAAVFHEEGTRMGLGMSMDFSA